MNMGKKITDLREAECVSGESSYPVSMGDGTGVKQVKHKNLVNQLLTDMEMTYDETLEMLRAADGNGDKKIPNVKAISEWIASKITNNLLATEKGFFLDARLGPVIDTRFKAVEDRVDQINSDLAFLNFSGDTILNFYESHPACKGCFVVGTNRSTDMPSGISEGYVKFYRDEGGNRVIVLFYDYSGNHKIFMRSIFREQWLSEWTQINS